MLELPAHSDNTDPFWRLNLNAEFQSNPCGSVEQVGEKNMVNSSTHNL